MSHWMIYTRVSTEDQVQGASLDAQGAACRAMATARGWTVGTEVTDAGATGKNLKRPGAQQMITAVRAKTIAGIITWKLDRLTRSLRDLIELVQLCDANGVALVSVTESIDTSGPMGRFTVHLLGAIAQLERETISQRTRFGMAHRRAQGAHLGGLTPTGLRVVTRDGLRVLEVDPKRGPIISKLWAMVIAGASMKDCCHYLTENCVPTQRGGAWSTGSISLLLSNKRVIGMLVDDETQQRALDVLFKRTRPGRRIANRLQRPTDRVWRLHGIARCAKCGSALISGHARGSKGKNYPYLRCSGRMRRGDCDAPPLPAEAYEDGVIQRVAHALVDTDGLVRELKASARFAHEQASGCEDERALMILERDRIKQKLNLALDAAVEGGAVARAWSSRIAALQNEVEVINLQVAELDGKMAAASMTESECDTLMLGVVEDAARLPTLDWVSQQKHLRAWVRQVRLSPEVIEADLYVPTLVGQVRTNHSEWVP